MAARATCVPVCDDRVHAIDGTLRQRGAEARHPRAVSTSFTLLPWNKDC